MSEHHQLLYDQVTDDMLRTPVKDLSDYEVDLLHTVFSGPLGQLLIDRMDEHG